MLVTFLLTAEIAFPSPRIQKDLPTHDLRQNMIRFTDGAVGQVNISKIINGRSYPHVSYTLGQLGATNCSNILDHAQTFPLQGMLKSKYIDQNTYLALRDSEPYLDAAQVIFFNVFSYLSAEEFSQHRESIDDSQLGLAPPRSQQELDSVGVTVGSAYLVTGYRHTSKSILQAPLPWTKDPAFAPVAMSVLQKNSGFNYEFGRAMQIIPGTLELNIKAALITIAQEFAVLKGNFHESRIFVHSYKPSNTYLYKKMFPSFETVAIDPQNPDNVILASPLEPLYSKDFPWLYSGVIQDLIAINPDIINVTKAWDFLMALRMSMRMNLDFHGHDGHMSPSPVILRPPFPVLEEIIFQHIRKLGVIAQKDADQIVQLLNEKANLSESGRRSTWVDPISNDAPFLHHHFKNMVSVTNLDPQESKRDPQYELRILMGSVLQYGELLRSAGYQHGFENANYVVTTTDLGIADRLSSLSPTQNLSLSWEQNWDIKENLNGTTLNFSQTTAKSFIFTFHDLQRLAQDHLELFQELTTLHPSLTADFFQREGILGRATGL